MSLHGPSLVKGLILMWCDRLDEARPVLPDECRNMLDCGDEASPAIPTQVFSVTFT